MIRIIFGLLMLSQSKTVNNREEGTKDTMNLENHDQVLANSHYRPGNLYLSTINVFHILSQLFKSNKNERAEYYFR